MPVLDWGAVPGETGRTVARGAGQHPRVVVDHPGWGAAWRERGVQWPIPLPERHEEHAGDFGGQQQGGAGKGREVGLVQVVIEAQGQAGRQTRTAAGCQTGAEQDLCGGGAQSMSQAKHESGERLVVKRIEAAG